MSSSDYHDYVIKDGTFIGEFDRMYQNVRDPWQCTGQVGAFKNSLLVGAVYHLADQVGRALDVGCGLGALTARLHSAVPTAEWHACDVSPTAVASAARDNAAVRFFVHDLTNDECLPFAPGGFDLITMAEVMWYVLPNLDRVFSKFRSALRMGGHLMLLQYFLVPQDQKYGREIVSAPSDLVSIISRSGFSVCQEVYLNARPPYNLLVWASKAEK